MLTRHSPPRAVGCAEAGWLVGESDGRSRPSMRPSDRPNFLSFPITVHNAGPGENRSPWCSLGSPARNKKSPRASHPVSPGRRPRRVGSLSDPGGQAGFLLDRCGGQTPALSLESSTVAAHGQPQNRRTGQSMESHPLILRNLRTKSKKKFADCSVFSSSRAPVMLLRSRHGLSLPGQASFCSRGSCGRRRRAGQETTGRASLYKANFSPALDGRAVVRSRL